MSKTELLKQLEAKRTRCQVWTREMGYLRNTDNFNIGTSLIISVRLFHCLI